jgi:HD-GYP domain-containing protein (c-di-GMP phosphodiesterase class II)
MSNILVWGKARDLVAGDMPPGIGAVEVTSLQEIEHHLDGTQGNLVLVDRAHLETEAAGLEKWLLAGGNLRIVIVAVVEPGEADETLRRFPFLDDFLMRPVSPTRIRLRLDRTLDAIHSRRVIQQLDSALTRKSQELHELNKIGVALSAEKDVQKLLQMILGKTREITAADAGSLYLTETKDGADFLRFELPQNDSVGVGTFEKKVFPLNETSIAGYAALSGQSVNVADAYHLPPGTPYTVSRSFDERSGYRTKSMLVVPMRDHQEKVIGVVQLINKKRDPNVLLKPVSLVEENVIPFTSVDVELVTSLASQAAVALENTFLIESIRGLFDSFVHASVSAIESRDPTTSGHSERVRDLTVGLAEKVDGVETGLFRDVRFTPDQLKEIAYASLLHDFGKVGVREKLLIKGKKLYVGEILLIKQRFSYIRKSLEADHLRAKLDQVLQNHASQELLTQMDRAHEDHLKELQDLVRMILQANEPSILEEEGFRALMSLPARTFTDGEGNPQPFLTPNEVSALSIRRGSLSDAERREIESHVTHTYNFLAQIPWTGEFRRVPEIAYAHHEKLDGSGYPRRLSADAIPIQSKMMTISDIYDALVAWDRPYKKSVPVEKALTILKEEASRGKIDGALLNLFIDAKVYEKTLLRPRAEVEVAR